MGLRAELVAHLEAELPAGVTVYNVGADVIATPCVVITYGEPAQAITNYGGDYGLAVALNLVLITNRGEPAAAADALEDLAYQIRQALRSFPIGSQAPTTSGFGAVAEVAGVNYPTTTIEALFKDRDRGATLP